MNSERRSEAEPVRVNGYAARKERVESSGVKKDKVRAGLGEGDRK